MQDAGRQGRSGVEWYHPGEIVLVTRVPRDRSTDESQLNAQVHAAVHAQARDYLEEDHSGTRSFSFDAPGEAKSLVFGEIGRSL